MNPIFLACDINFHRTFVFAALQFSVFLKLCKENFYSSICRTSLMIPYGKKLIYVLIVELPPIEVAGCTLCHTFITVCLHFLLTVEQCSVCMWANYSQDCSRVDLDYFQGQNQADTRLYNQNLADFLLTTCPLKPENNKTAGSYLNPAVIRFYYIYSLTLGTWTKC